MAAFVEMMTILKACFVTAALSTHTTHYTITKPYHNTITHTITHTRSLERHLKYFGLVDGGGKAISILEWATLAQDRAGWLKLVTKVPFDIGKPQLRPPRCDTRDQGHARGEAEVFG